MHDHAGARADEPQPPTQSPTREDERRTNGDVPHVEPDVEPDEPVQRDGAGQVAEVQALLRPDRDSDVDESPGCGLDREVLQQRGIDSPHADEGEQRRTYCNRERSPNKDFEHVKAFNIKQRVGPLSL